MTDSTDYIDRYYQGVRTYLYGHPALTFKGREKLYYNLGIEHALEGKVVPRRKYRDIIKEIKARHGD